MKKLLLVLSLVILVAILASACAQAAPKTMTSSQTWTAPSTIRPSMTTTATMTVTPGPAKVPTITSIPAPTITAVPPAPVTTTVGGSQKPSENIGLATGGAKDINNFRENIYNNYLPLPTDVTCEGLFYDYFFDTGTPPETNKLYTPAYSFAVTRDPFSHDIDYYLAVGLNSGLKEADFQRKKLNLVIVMDISGSMGAEYDQYYYDRYGQVQDAYAGEGVARPNKIDTAKTAVIGILNQLQDYDRFAVVLFNSKAWLAKPMGTVGNTDMRSVRDNVSSLNAGGSTALSAGMAKATEQFNQYLELNSYEYENRVIILTDAQPNTGDISSSGMMGAVQRNAANRIYTTFIGIGVDFNSSLIEEITKTKGANYYSMHSPREFRERIDDEFDFMVTPLVFNLRLNFESQGWRIEKVFGSPEANQATGELMKINTLFPSKSEGGEVKGGIVLLKLQMLSFPPKDKVYLRVTYEDRNGRTDSSAETIYLEGAAPEYFENTGIRKGVLLSRYATLLQNWMIDERRHARYSQPWDPCIDEDTGIIFPPQPGLSEWERQSMPLVVSPPYARLFRDFSRYFQSEMQAIGDYTLDQEIQVLNRLAS